MKFIILRILRIYNLVIRIFYKILGYKKITNFDGIKNILFFKVGSMGDNIITFPTIYSIKESYPNIEITILTNSGGENLVSIEKLIDLHYIKEFINYTGKGKYEVIKSLKYKKYDLLIDLTQPTSLINTIRNMIIFKILGIQKAVGWQISELSYFRKLQDKFLLVGSEMEKYLASLKKYDIKLKREFILGITQDEIATIDTLLIENNLEHKKIIALIVGSKRTTNRWPIEYFDEVIKYINHKTDFIPIVIGGDEDKALTSKITSKLVDFCGKLKPLQSAELLKRCKLVISNDTGPMHLSYAVGTPVISIFSARDFRNKWYPPMDLGIVLRDEEIDCRLCYKESCEHLSCLINIKPDKVIQIMTETISEIYR